MRFVFSGGYLRSASQNPRGRCSVHAGVAAQGSDWTGQPQAVPDARGQSPDSGCAALCHPPREVLGSFLLNLGSGGNVPETLKEELWILAGSSP